MARIIRRRLETSDLFDQTEAATQTAINAAYERGVKTGRAQGFAQAIAVLSKLSEEQVESGVLLAVREAGPGALSRPISASSIVAKIIKEKPGLTGVEIFDEIKKQGYNINYHTMRTAIHRLKRKVIRQRKKKWFPVPEAKEVHAASQDEEVA